jgi:hypothetical protein
VLVRSDISIGTRAAEVAGRYLQQCAQRSYRAVAGAVSSGWRGFRRTPLADKLTLGLLVATFVQARIANEQLGAMREDIANSKSAADKQAAAAPIGDPSKYSFTFCEHWNDVE